MRLGGNDVQISVRDFVGYGPDQPHPKWPDRVRFAINFGVNVVKSSEPSVEPGEGYTEVQHTPALGRSQGVNGRDLAGESMFEYGSRVGFWRILRPFQERNLALMAFACTLALERNPPIATAIRVLDKEGRSRPKVMSAGLHPRPIGHPARAAGLQRLLDHVRQRSGVWIARRVDIAHHFIATHPYPGKGLNED